MALHCTGLGGSSFSCAAVASDRFLKHVGRPMLSLPLPEVRVSRDHTGRRQGDGIVSEGFA